MKNFKKFELIKNAPYYILALPSMVMFALFTYFTMPGLIIAFKKYNLVKGMWDSPWNGLDNFRFMLIDPGFGNIVKNTLLINFTCTLVEAVIAITFAIFIGEIINKLFKRTVQTLIFMPYFFSSVIVGWAAYLLFNYDQGVVNRMLLALNQTGVDWYAQPKYWLTIITSFSVWKYAGYSVIMYLGTITSVDHELYEAAEIDGAGGFQRIRYIILPFIVPTFITLMLLSVGNFMKGNFDLIYAIAGPYPALIPTTDVIETYLYRAINTGATNFGKLTAISLFQSLVGMILVIVSNTSVKNYDKNMGLF